MASQRQDLEEWFAKRRGPRHPADEAAALAAADAFDAMRLACRPCTEHLDVLISAAGNPRSLVWNCGSALLSKSLREWPEVAGSIAAMLQDRRATARFSAMCCVEGHMPPAVADAMIRAGLEDKSGQVRWKAGEAANRLHKSDLIPLLSRVAAAEKPGRVRQSLEHSLRMLRDGYILDPLADGTYSFWINTANGSCGKMVDKAELDAKGIDKVVAEFRASR